jgi:uncharacterized protein
VSATELAPALSAPLWRGTASCIYEGTVRHRRLDPRREFRHRLALAYIDLDELPFLLGGKLVAPRAGLVRLRRPDYLGDPAVPLAEAVRDTVQVSTGRRPDGPVRLLAHLRSFGHCFNPVSFYYCFEATGGRLQALVAEVTNTPWGERHAYVVGEVGMRGNVISGEFDKSLHVSPFLEMDYRYTTRATAPADTLSVHIENRRRGELAFDATLALARRELTAASLRRATARYPAATLRVLALIYGRAVGLKLAGARVYRHPGAQGDQA